MGRTRLTTTNGKIQKTGQFLNGKQQGLWTQTFAKDEGHLFSADQDGEYIGPFTSEATFVDGQLQGTWTIKNRDGRNIVEWNFDHGVPDGKWSWWYPNGQERLEAIYKNNKLDGEVTEWSFRTANKSAKPPISTASGWCGWSVGTRWARSGSKAVACGPAIFPTPPTIGGTVSSTPPTRLPNAPDQKHGTWIEWYPNGKKKLEAQYDHNVAVGKFTWWYENGQKQAEVEYSAGVLDGMWITWHPNGLKESAGPAPQRRTGRQVGGTGTPTAS